MNQISINTVYNCVKISDKSRKFIDVENYGCRVSTVTLQFHQMTTPTGYVCNLDTALPQIMIIVYGYDQEFITKKQKDHY